MKKTIVGISTRMGAGIDIVLAAALTVQATALLSIDTDDIELKDFNDMFLEMRSQLDQTNADASELNTMISDLIDPISFKSFDFMAFGTQMLATGMITDLSNYTDAATTIKNKGFMAYVDELKTRMSALDLKLANIEVKVTTWAKLDEDDRVAAVFNNTDDNIIVPLAQLYTSVVNFKSYVMAGMLMVAQMSHVDKDAKSDDAVADRQLADAEA